MFFPIAIVTGYLAINFAMIVWLAREEAGGRSVPPSVVLIHRAMRWGPPIVGFLYLVTIAGDWPYVLFVGGFFALAFWLLDSLLNYPPPPRR